MSNGNNSEYSQKNLTNSEDDIDTDRYRAEVDGEEAVGGDAPTPDQDIVDKLGTEVGLEMDDKTALWTTEALEKRDSQRWELEPKSSEDYEEHYSN